MKKRNLLILLVALAVLAAIVFSRGIFSKARIAPLFPGLRVKYQGEKNTDYVRSQMDVCFKNGRDKCYKDVASLLTKQFKLADSLNLLEETEQYPEVYSRCHEVTHFLARNAYERSRNVPDLYGQCTFVCHGGCYHGVIEGYFKGKEPLLGQSDSILGPEIRKICGNRSNYSKVALYFECVHGIGHAMMFITDGDLPRSLKLCDALAESEREPCYGGVFMENSSSSTNVDHPAKFVKKDDPLYPCDTLESRYLHMCYTYQSSYFLNISGHLDWPQNIKLCHLVPSEYRRFCFTTVGTNIVGSSIVDGRVDLGQTSKICNLIKESEFKSECVSGVVISLAGRYGGSTAPIVDYCSSVEPAYKKSCYNQMGISLSSFVANSNDLSKVCNSIKEVEYMQYCLKPRAI